MMGQNIFVGSMQWSKAAHLMVAGSKQEREEIRVLISLSKA
jgi:hypothetical protein